MVCLQRLTQTLPFLGEKPWMLIGNVYLHDFDYTSQVELSIPRIISISAYHNPQQSSKLGRPLTLPGPMDYWHHMTTVSHPLGSIFFSRAMKSSAAFVWHRTGAGGDTKRGRLQRSTWSEDAWQMFHSAKKRTKKKSESYQFSWCNSAKIEVHPLAKWGAKWFTTFHNITYRFVDLRWANYWSESCRCVDLSSTFRFMHLSTVSLSLSIFATIAPSIFFWLALGLQFCIHGLCNDAIWSTHNISPSPTPLGWRVMAAS